MKIHVPIHLRKIEVIDQMCKMIEEYGENFYIDTTDSFENYYYYLKLDPVKRFLNLCISRSDLYSGQDYEVVINYLSRLFYSVKGTIKVFEYMRRYLGLNFEGDIIYTTKYIEFKLSDISLTDEKMFYQYLKEFLDALLYFQELRIIIDAVNLVLSGNINNYVYSGITCYNEITAEIYEAKD